MKIWIRKMYFLAIIIIFSSQYVMAETTVSAINNLIITDVTPEKFSVIWASHEPSSCSLAVYSDPTALNEISSQLTIISESEIHVPAENNGVMKVTVKQLRKETTYYFKTITISKQNNIRYISDKVYTVTTEKESGFVTNTILVQQIYNCDGQTPASGTLLIVMFKEASYPLSSWTADGYPEGFAGVDLMNFYSKTTRTPLEIEEYGSSVTLNAFGGLLGYANTQAIVDESYFTQSIPRDAVLTSLIDVILGLQVLAGLENERKPCFKDIDSDNQYDLHDLINTFSNLQ